MPVSLEDWLNNQISGVVGELENLNRKYFFDDKTIGFAGKESVYRAIHYLRSALFPGVYEKFPIDESRVNIIIGNNLREAALEIGSLIEKALKNICERPDKDHADCNLCVEKASEYTIELIKKLTYIREMLQKDIIAAYNGDPAALSNEEILLSYPSLEAVSIYRIAHELYRMKVPLIPRIMSEYAHRLTGIDIHPGAEIGEYFFIDHGTGVVIGETCKIGNNVKIYQGVTLGARSFKLDANGNPVKGIKRHPDIEDNVIIYAGATILGGDTIIGHDSVIGGNVFILHSVPPFSTVYNTQPAPDIRQKSNGL